MDAIASLFFHFNPVFVISSIITIFVFLLGVIVYLNNSRNIVNRLFFLLTLSATVWGFFVLIQFRGYEDQTILIVQRFGFAAAAILAVFLLYFCYYFPKKIMEIRRIYVLASIAVTGFIVVISLLTPYVVRETHRLQGNLFQSVYGVGYYIFSAYFLIYLLLAIRFMYSKIKYLTEIEAKQSMFILIGIIISSFIAIVTNLILPLFIENNYYSQFGPSTLVFFFLFSAYAIVKHRLFNIKSLLVVVLNFIVWSVLFLHIFTANTGPEMVFNTLLFVIVASVGILFIEGFFREVDQREKIETLVVDLEIANKKLQQTDAARREFLSFASHQMRTPMTIIKGMASVVSESVKTMSPEKIKMSADKIIEATERLNKFSLNLTDARAIEEGRMQYQFQEVDIVKIISSVIEEFRQIANKKGLILTFESTKSEAMIKADTNKLQQVIQNLIDNALKFTEHGFVKVSIEGSKPDTVSISIIDSGGGMPPETIKNLFQPFMHRFASVSGVKSTGLGLYIAKEIANAHGGSIRAESEGEGKGSRFILEFPVIRK
jgi:signal transduction histidine kinase